MAFFTSQFGWRSCQTEAPYVLENILFVMFPSNLLPDYLLNNEAGIFSKFFFHFESKKLNNETGMVGTYVILSHQLLL